MKQLISLLRYLATISGVVFGVLLLVELVAWAVSPGRYDDPPAVTADVWIHSDALSSDDRAWLPEFVEEFCASYHAEWTPYVYFRRIPYGGRLINVDSSGNRYTPQWALKRGNGTRPKRIFLFGGSTMWGTGARDSNTIPAVLSRLIAEDTALGAAEVVNMGESGYVSTQSVIRLQRELQQANIPDLVIFYDGVNDIFSAYQNSTPGIPQNEIHRSLEFNLLKERGRMASLLLDSLWSRTLTASLVRTLRTSLSSDSSPPPKHLEQATSIVDTYRRNLGIVEALSGYFGFRYLAYWQPVALVKPNLTAYERKQSEALSHVRPLFREVYRRIRDDAVLRKNPRFHNVSDVFDSTAFPVYLDFCHITEAGNAVVARRMYGDIAGFRGSGGGLPERTAANQAALPGLP